MWRYQSAINHSWLESPWLYVAVPKHIMIENHRLGLVLRIFQLSVVLSLFGLYTGDRKWMLRETTPEGFQAYWTDSEGAGFQKQKTRDEQWAFCKSPKSVEYQLQEANGIVHTYSAEGCADLMPGEEYIKGESSMYIPTYFQDQWMRQTAGVNCKHLKRCCRVNSDSVECEDMIWEKYGTYKDLEAKSLLGEAICQCAATRSYFVRGVTGLNISLVPSFRAEDPSTGKQYMGTTKRKDDDILVVVNSAKASDAPNRVTSMLQVGEEPAKGGGSPASLVAVDAVRDATASAPPIVEPRGLAGGSLGAAGMGGALAFPVPAVQPVELSAHPVGPPGHSKGAASGARRKGGRGSDAERAAIEVDSSGGFRRESPSASLAEEAAAPGEAAAPPTSEAAEAPRIRRESGEAAGLGQAMPPPAFGVAEPPRIRREGVEAEGVQAAAERPAMAPPLRERRAEPRRGLFGSLLDAVTGSSGPTHEVATYFEPGEVVGMSVEDWLRHAALLGIGPMSHVTSRTDSVLDAENLSTKRNELSSDVQHATFRTTGLELTIDMQFQNEEVHKRKDHKGHILLIKVVARPDWEEVPVVHNILPLEPMSGNAHTVKRHYHGIRIRFQSGGKFASFSLTSMLATASSFILYLQVPSMIISFIAIYLLGVSSEFYYEAANERMALKTIACNYIARLLQAYSAFRAGKDLNRKGKKQRAEGEDGMEGEDEDEEDMAEHEDPKLCFTRDRLIQEVQGLAESEQPDFDSDISKLADMMLEEHDDDRKGFLSAEDLTQATLDTDATTLKGIGDLIDSKRNKPFFEKLFVPNMHIQDERSVLLRAKKAELVAMMKARQQAEQRMARAAALREEEQTRLEAEQAQKDEEAELARKEEEAAAAAAQAEAEEQEQEEGPSTGESAKEGAEAAEPPIVMGSATLEDPVQEASALAPINVPSAPMGITGGVTGGALPGSEPPVAPPPPATQFGGGPPPFGAPGGAPPPFGAPGGAPPPFGAPGGPPPPFGGPGGPPPHFGGPGGARPPGPDAAA